MSFALPASTPMTRTYRYMQDGNVIREKTIRVDSFQPTTEETASNFAFREFTRHAEPSTVEGSTVTLEFPLNVTITYTFTLA